MEARKFIIYDNKKYHSNGRYYYADFYTNGKSIKKALHRIIWEKENGSIISKGYCIHHIDGNVHNNNPNNLELMERGEHQRQHMIEKMKDPEFEKRHIEILNKHRHKAAVWHGSKEGLIWHSDHGKECWENRKLTKVECINCGKQYDTPFPTRARFCHVNCIQQYAYKHKRYHEQRQCIICSCSFSVRKNEKTKTCSRNCSIKSRQYKKTAILATV